MPVLRKTVIQDFRNIAFQELEFTPNVNCISGNNGEGKTNLLDAIWYLSMTKSAFAASDKFNIRYGAKGFTLSGAYEMTNGLESRFTVQVDAQGEKKMKRDEKAYTRISEHIGVLPVVMVSPSDTALVSESGDERRRFVNAVVSQMDREYMAAAQQYNRLLLQRNKMLKDERPDMDLLAVVDMQMGQAAEVIAAGRRRFVEAMGPMVAKNYASLSAGAEEVAMEYRTDLDKGSLEEVFAAHREKDLMFRYTTAGVQRDDFIFTMNGYPIRRCGSQGQQKSFLVSLKFAQYGVMKENCGFAPILLLDDVFDKLDMQRISNLLQMVAGSGFGQIFITDSNKVRMQGIVDSITSDSAYFDTVRGEFTRL